MTHIVIGNIGPIIKAELPLNKVTVIMGQQSSGKSTIAKIVSYCTWVEKDIATNLSYKHYTAEYFKEKLETYHNIKGYFKDNSYIRYESETIFIEYATNELNIRWIDKYSYKRNKISYIPAERNMIVLPEAEKLELANNSIRSFLFDWFNARKKHQYENSINILNLGVRYYFNESNRENHIEANNSQDKYDILLSNASSGLQSIVPMIVMIDFLTDWIYNNEEELSFEEQEKKQKVSGLISIERVIVPYTGKTNLTIDETRSAHKEVSELLEKDDSTVVGLIYDWLEKRDNLFKTAKTQFIIEEPEQNLFPESQRDILYYLLKKITRTDKDHGVFLTTHSPYILYALNNCMMGHLGKDAMPEKVKDSLLCHSSIINPINVSIYEIRDGELVSIQEPDGLIRDNYFDKQMKLLMDDFYTMLNYYGDDKNEN